MGCGLSKKDGSDHIVSLCKERKKLMKLAVKQRQAFADAHCRYIHSLYGVSAAIKLFVARYSSPSSPFLISMPSPMSIQSANDSGNARAGNGGESASDSLMSDARVGEKSDKEDEEEDEGNSGVCEHFYGDNHGENYGRNDDKPPPPMPSPRRESGWDFFNLFDDGYRVLSEYEMRNTEHEAVNERGGERIDGSKNNTGSVKSAEVRKVKKGNGGRKGEGNCGGVNVIDDNKNGRELLEVLKDLEDHFVRAYESGFDVSRMLEVNYKVPHQSGLEEIKENSSGVIHPLMGHRTYSLQSSPCMSLLSSSSRSSSTWTESRSELFDGCGGMESGSHSFTLGRIYAWEKKLFKEVKDGEHSRRSYRQKCSQVKKKDGGNEFSSSKKGDEVAILYNRILIGIRTAESISGQIDKLRDDELQPQLVELLHGLMKSWKVMMDCHDIQKKTILEVKSFSCPSNGKFSNDSHRLATLQLEAELRNWHTTFLDYISTQKAYIKSLHRWLSKFIDAEARCNSEGWSTPQMAVQVQFNGPPLIVTCQNWLASLERLPDTAVKGSMKSLATDVRALWAQQGQEQQLKKKIDGLAKEMDRRTIALRKEEDKVSNSKMIEQVSLVNVKNQVESINERKNQLEVLKQQLEAEKVRHQCTVEDTQGRTLSTLQRGFSSVFESLTDFSRASVKLYADLVVYCENARGGQREA